jgi:LPXTG-site transpeptidase (sortase) family protein
MRRFLIALFVPILIVAALNWRTLWSLTNFYIFPPKPFTAEKLEQAEQQQANNTLAIPSLGLLVPVLPSETDPMNASDWATLRKDLTQGVSLAERLAKPGERGLTIITGHSSDYTPHQYAAVFAGLNFLNNDDDVVLKYGDKLYHYKIAEKQIIDPTQLAFFEDKIEALGDKNQLALVTCWPIFTSAKRLVVLANPVQ